VTLATLTMPQRAAVVLAQLDDDRAQRVLASMSELEVISIMAEMSKLPIMRAEDVDEIIGEFADQTGALLQVRQGGTELAQRWLRDRLGMSRASEVMVELQSIMHDHPLMFLNRIEPAQIVGFLGDEHPQTVALVLANLHVEHAARVFEELDEKQRVEIARRMATMAPVPTEVVKKIAGELESRLSAFVRSGRVSAEVGGVSSVVALLNNADRAAERQILSGIEDADPDLAERIRNEMFVFDDVMALDDNTLQVALRSVVMKDMALALKGKPPQMVEKVTRNISERAAEDLLEDMTSLGPQRVSVVEAAEAAIVKAVRELADAGEITIGRGNDELVG
jgi:flagellar motor switch protein FliG